MFNFTYMNFTVWTEVSDKPLNSSLKFPSSIKLQRRSDRSLTGQQPSRTCRVNDSGLTVGGLAGVKAGFTHLQGRAV